MPLELSAAALECLDLADLTDIKAKAVGALKAVLSGEQSYEFAGRRVSRADIGEIQAVILRCGRAIAAAGAQTVVPDFRTNDWQPGVLP
jgi:hypothetical protein